MTNFSIIQKSQLDEAYRMDAEYFTTNFAFKDYYLGGQVAEFIQYGTSDDLNEDGIGYPTLRLNEFDSYFIKEPEKYCNKIGEQQFANLKLKKNDVLICRTNGNPQLVGKSAIVMEDQPYAFASYLFRVRTDTAKISPSTLTTYLHTSYGRSEIEKNMMISNQTNFSPARFKLTRIPKFKKDLQDIIDRLIIDAYGLSKSYKSLYQQAEDLLLKELGLKDFQVGDDLSFVVNLSNVNSAKRVDAEYFQPKYEKLISKLELQTVNKLEDFVKDYSTGFTFKSENYQEDGIPLIRINNIKKGFVDLSDTAYLSEKDYLLSPKDIAKPGNIVLSMSGTIGMSAVIPTDVVKCSINQRILRFTPKGIDPDLLVLILNSVIGSYQLERIGTGGVQTNISYRDIQNILIPVLLKPTQEKIAELVRKSHEARKKSKELLEQAKRKVEEMIEKGER